MVMIDVYVPILDATYDFGIEEKASVESVKEEIIEMISQKEQYRSCKNEQGFMLFSAQTGMALPPQSTMESCGVNNGTRLILI